MSPSDRRAFLRHSAAAAAAVALTPTLATLEPLARWRGAPVRVALVGAGRQGRALLGELQKMEAAEVVAVCDVVASRLRSGLRRAQGARGYEAHAELLEREDDFDAVLVATPTHAHRAVCVDALAAGRHVFCEAPLASTVEDARAIAQAARKSGKVFHTGLAGRSNPVYQLAWGFHRTGALRDMVDARAQDRQKRDWKTPVSDPADEAALNWRLDPAVSIGLAGELATHQLDVAHWFLGEYPVAVSGSGSVQLYKDGREVHDTAACDFEFPSGLRLAWQGTLANSYGGRYELLAGSMAAFKLAWSHGWMFKEADAPTQGWEVYANRDTFHNDQGITLIADATQLASQGKLKEGVGLPHPPEHYALADFLKSVGEGAPVVCSAEEGLRAAVVGIHAHRATVEGGRVAIDPKLLEVG